MGDFNSLPDNHLKGFPLKQIVRASTRGQAILDKICTNIADWFNNPVILKPIGKSDHQTVVAYSTSNSNWLFYLVKTLQCIAVLVTGIAKYC